MERKAAVFLKISENNPDSSAQKLDDNHYILSADAKQSYFLGFSLFLLITCIILPYQIKYLHKTLYKKIHLCLCPM